MQICLGCSAGKSSPLIALNRSCAKRSTIIYSEPFFQTTYTRTAIAVYTVLLLSFITYARFCFLVINDITNFLGIACFTVRKKDAQGVWRNTATSASNDGSVKNSGGEKANGHTKRD